jgi:hypothetical protein
MGPRNKGLKLRLSRESGEEVLDVREAANYSPAPTQQALCLRLATMYEAESCYVLQPSMTRLHNAELVN